jgi:hypothetical protein
MSNQGLNRAVIAHLPDAPIKDELIAQIARQDPENPPPGCPIDDDLSVDLIKRRKSSFAAPLAAMLTSPAAIDAVAAREYRRAVWFGLAANPNLTFTALAHLTEYAGRQRSRVSEDLAYEVIVNGIGSDTRVTLELLTTNRWLRRSDAGSRAKSSVANTLGQLRPAQIRQFMELEPSPSLAGQALNSLLDERSSRLAQLKPEVVLPLYIRAHGTSSTCGFGCHDIAKWALKHSPSVIDELFATTRCRRTAIGLLAHFQKVGDHEMTAKLLGIITKRTYQIGGHAESFIDSDELDEWFEALAKRRVTIDSTLARTLVDIAESGSVGRIHLGKLPDYTPAALEIFAASTHWEIAIAAITQLDDPVKVVKYGAAQMSSGERARMYNVKNAIVELSDYDVQLELAQAPTEIFTRWAAMLWDTNNVASCKPFVDRSIAELPLDSLEGKLDKLDAAQLVKLADRTSRLDPTTLSDADQKVITALLTDHVRLLDDQLRWRLLVRIAPSKFHSLMGYKVTDPVDLAIRPGEYAKLLELRADAKDELLRRLKYATEAHWVDEMLELIPLKWDEVGPAVWKTVNARFAAAFGDNKDLWSVAVGLLETWSATLQELIDTTLTLAGLPTGTGQPDLDSLLV